MGRNAFDGRCVSVCLSVCHVPDPKSRKELCSKLKIRRKEARDMDDPWPHLVIERSKVISPGHSTPWPKISRIFGTGRPTNFEVGIVWMRYNDMHQQDVRWPQRSKVKIITSSRHLDACLPLTRQEKVTEVPKMAEWLSLPRVIFSTSSKVKRSKVKVTRPLNAVTKISHIFGTDKPTIFIVGEQM